MAQEHYDRVRRIHPSASAELVRESFRVLLKNLNNNGEDTDRLVLWFCSIFEGTNDLGMRPGACKLWIEALDSWARKDSLALRSELHDIETTFASSYKEKVFYNYNTFGAEERHSGRQWMSTPEARSSYDNFLREIYFEEIRSHPAKFFYFFVRRRLNREWWREARQCLNKIQINALVGELVEYVSDTDIPEMIEWSHVIGIDEAFTIDRFPVFDEVARDW